MVPSGPLQNALPARRSHGAEIGRRDDPIRHHPVCTRVPGRPPETWISSVPAPVTLAPRACKKPCKSTISGSLAALQDAGHAPPPRRRPAWHSPWPPRWGRAATAPPGQPGSRESTGAPPRLHLGTQGLKGADVQVDGPPAPGRSPPANRPRPPPAGPARPPERGAEARVLPVELGDSGMAAPVRCAACSLSPSPPSAGPGRPRTGQDV